MSAKGMHDTIAKLADRKGKVVNAKRVVKKVLAKVSGRTELPVLDTNTAEITPYTFRKVSHDRKRMNLLVPSINTEHVFGGIATALKFFDTLIEELGFDARIILVDAEPNQEAIQKYSDRYVFADAEDNCTAEKQIIPYSRRVGKSLAVSENDYFMFTGWWTAYCAQTAYVEFERQTQIKPNTFLYFIQDYEPGFYPWSTRYLLADSTYKNENNTIAIFNSTLLKEYFEMNHYKFYKSYVFDPVLNDGLRKEFVKLPEQIRKKKQVLVYGRPGTERNAFNLVVAALKEWVKIQPDIAEWEILSAGEMHRSVPLGNEKELVSVGKLSIEAYAKMLEETYMGISLMCSPHPSYPPLEMSVFGVKTITNTYGNKDLKDFNSNIVSLDNISPINIAKHMNELCDCYSETVTHTIENEEYIQNNHAFDFVKEIKQVL